MVLLYINYGLICVILAETVPWALEVQQIKCKQ